MNGEIKSYEQLGMEYDRHMDKRTKQDIDERLFYLRIKHEVEDVDMCELRARDFGEDSDEAEELLAILGEIGAFWAKYEYEE